MFSFDILLYIDNKYVYLLILIYKKGIYQFVIYFKIALIKISHLEGIKTLRAYD